MVFWAKLMGVYRELLDCVEELTFLCECALRNRGEGNYEQFSENYRSIPLTSIENLSGLEKLYLLQRLLPLQENDFFSSEELSRLTSVGRQQQSENP